MSPRPGERLADDGATRELLGAWALDAVDDAERAAVEDLVVRDPDAEREARGLRETAGLLGAAVAVPAPETVRAATLAAVARTAQDAAGAARGGSASTADAPGTGTEGSHAVPARSTDPGTTRSRPPAGPRAATGPGRTRRPGRARLVLAALVAVVAIALPTTVAWQQGRRAAEAEARTDRITALLAEPGVRIATGTLTSGGEAVAVVTADAGLVTLTGAADPGADRVYQLWVMRDGQPLAAGTSDVVGGVAQISTDEFRTGDALALTVEPAGGSEQPTSEPVVVLAPA